MTDTGADLAAYTRVYEDHNARLTAYARTLTGDPATAEDLVAEAHFRVWRRISAGHPVENVPAYLATTIRNLANTLHRTTAEIPLPTESPETHLGRPATTTAAPQDPSQQIAHIDFVTRLLKDLPDRWVQALWLSEVEDLPLETIGRRIGATTNATAALLNRAREGLRQAFLRGYPGAPAEEACAKHWQKLPSLVRGGLSARQTDALRTHSEQCDDCRARLAALQQVNLRLPALLGPGLLAAALGGGSVRLVAAGMVGAGAKAGTVGAGAKAGAVGTGAKAAGGGARVGGKTGVVSAGVVVSAAIAVAAAALTGSPAHPHPAPHTPAEAQAAQTAAPVAETPSPQPAAKPSRSQPVQYAPRHAAPPAATPASASQTTHSPAQPTAAPQSTPVVTQPSGTGTPNPAIQPSDPPPPPTPPPWPTPGIDVSVPVDPQAPADRHGAPHLRVAGPFLEVTRMTAIRRTRARPR